MTSPTLTPDQATRQRRKIEKDKRRKNYHDQQVQGTNNSSIVSKRSVEKLYCREIQPELGSWFSHFVKGKFKRRSPAINRGYWIRMESVRAVLLRILELNLGKRVNVVNLGCGFDPLPFQMLSMLGSGGGEYDLKFFDVDYPDLVREKIKLVSEAAEIRDLIGWKSGQDEDAKRGEICTDAYWLTGCDLKDLQSYRDLLHRIRNQGDNNDGDDDAVSIFIAEVSLAYMKPEFADPVIEASSRQPNSHFIMLEQIMPDGAHNAFATKMLYHFEHLTSPIQCVESYPTKRLQVDRFKQSYAEVEIRNLWENWSGLVEDAVKTRLMQLEEFDEWEEFIIFCQHYMVLHATNCTAQLVYKGDGDGADGDLIYEDFKVDSDVTFAHEAKFESGEKMLQVKFPAVAALGETIFVNGGLKQARVDETLYFDYATGEMGLVKVIEEKGGGAIVPSARVCHSLTSVGGELILIGGRTRPGDYKDEVFAFNGTNWSQIGQLDLKRARHSVVKVSESELLIFGGLSGVNEKDDEPAMGDLFLLFNVQSREFHKVKVKLSGDGDAMVNLMSASMVYDADQGVGYLYGGMSDVSIPRVNDKLYKWTLYTQGDDDNNRERIVHLEVVFESAFFSRIGSRASLIQDSRKLLIVGGVSPTSILTRLTNVMTLDVQSFQFRSVEIPESVYALCPPIFIGFGYVENVASGGDENKKMSLIVGGGAVCYSFGSCYNSVYRLEY
ncbi:uncharacterized protein LODBEIA_P30160 [Lodderomyces beijingensis]|uniref:tRNA wybutosine-synthesizing protein 4 n=1 Tax=Lodderomyces beijingensis TaxID=1775926 RepID=A0ABP0ZRD3_9ASCO